MTDDTVKNFVGATLDLEERARDYVNEGASAKPALVIALKNFNLAHCSMRDAASEAMVGSRESAAREK